ncbi:uncharacterized protein LOC116852469 [Odontomachus brunneus]|uniref:uncharacterized protein LOC116852469 n=1 Tax=Odontomachus brunneus TaxID=486640 RepID=UPI0013F1AF4E|nr:uncharacterized protein LOC116852469 [Odontomachus brunneus]
MENIDHPKKKTKIWSTISMGLLECGIQVTDQQVRWKMNALMKRYKEVIDNNSKSGRGTIEFEWFQIMDNFLGKKGSVTTAGYTISSKVCLEKMEPSTSQSSMKKFQRNSQKVSEQSAITNMAEIEKSSSNSNIEGNKTLTTHGTGSNIAKTKIELEKQWLKHLQLKEERDITKEERNKDLIESKKEALKLKKKHLVMKAKEMEQKHDIAINKMSEKKKRHADIMGIERLKYKLLKKFIEKKENINIDVSEESD